MNADYLFILAFRLLIVYGIGCLGKKRRIGFWWAFILSFVSPIIGLIVVLCTKKMDNPEYIEVDKDKKE